MLATEIVRQGEFACEKACSCADGVISRRGNDQATTFFNQLNLPPRFDAELSPELPRNKNLPL